MKEDSPTKERKGYKEIRRVRWISSTSSSLKASVPSHITKLYIKNHLTMKYTIIGFAAIVVVTAASTGLERRADPILEFNCNEFKEVCKTQCYGNKNIFSIFVFQRAYNKNANIPPLRCILC